MKKRIVVTLVSVVTLVLLAAPATAQILATDDFSYPDGPLVGNGGWVNQSGTAGTLLVASEEAVVTQDGGSEDVELVVSSDLTTGILTADFDVRVTAPGAMAAGDDEYFAHFSDDTDFNFRSRVYAVPPTSGGDYTLGFSSTSGGVTATLPTDFTFGAVVPASISFDLDTGTGSLTAGGNTVFGDALGAGEILDAFNFRQSSSASDETAFVDNLVVSYVPEPATGLFAIFGMLGILIFRRR